MSARGNSTLVWWISALAVIGVCLAWWSSKPAPVPSMPVAETPPKAAPPATVAARPKPAPAILAPLPEPPAVVRKTPTEAELQAMILKTAVRSRVGGELRMSVFKAGLQLTPQEYDRLVEHVIDFNHARAQAEKAVLKVASFDGTTLTLQIPAYPEQGSVLKADFVKKLEENFSGDTAQAITRALDGGLNPAFGGFGRFSQTEVVTADPENIQIRYYASVAGDVQATDSATLEEILRLSGSESLGRDGLPIYHEAIAEVVNAHFPVK